MTDDTGPNDEIVVDTTGTAAHFIPPGGTDYGQDVAKVMGDAAKAKAGSAPPCPVRGNDHEPMGRLIEAPVAAAGTFWHCKQCDMETGTRIYAVGGDGEVIEDATALFVIEDPDEF